MTKDVTSATLVHTVTGATEVTVEHGHVYVTDDGPLGFDVYRPPQRNGPSAAVVIANGLPDPGVVAMLGKPIKDWTSYVGWARMIAASGIAVIAYTNRTAADGHALVRHLRANAEALGLDAARIGVWACSGHVPTALGLFAQERLACAALIYGYMLDVDGATRVAEAAKQFYFAVPAITIDDLPRERPMLVVRAGKDATPGLDETLLRFVAAARERALAITLIDHAEAPHAFDMVDDSPETHRAIEGVLAFLTRSLG